MQFKKIYRIVISITLIISVSFTVVYSNYIKTKENNTAVEALSKIGSRGEEVRKIQKKLKELGYYKGGFTRRSINDHDEVGVVHANEFVVNARATANPAVVPFLNLVDYAQRNNTESALTPEDVSHALGTGAVVSATATTAKESAQGSGELLLVAASMQTSAQAIERLNTRLDEGIESYMVMDGERGVDKKYNEYLKLTNNSKR